MGTENDINKEFRNLSGVNADAVFSSYQSCVVLIKLGKDLEKMTVEDIRQLPAVTVAEWQNTMAKISELSSEFPVAVTNFEKITGGARGVTDDFISQFGQFVDSWEALTNVTLENVYKYIQAVFYAD